MPFLRQEINPDTDSLINQYNEYLHDTEARAIRLFQEYSKQLTDSINDIKELENETIKMINDFNEYKTKYIPSFESISLAKIDKKQLAEAIQGVIDKINEKLKKH